MALLLVILEPKVLYTINFLESRIFPLGVLILYSVENLLVF